MSLLDRLKSDAIELRCALRVAPHVAKFATPGLPWSVARELSARVRERPDALALAYLDQRFTYAELDAHIQRYTHLFQARGVGPGTVIALLMDNRPDFLFIVFALVRLRAVASLINTNLVGEALQHAIRVCQPRALIAGTEHRGVTAPCEIWWQDEHGDAELDHALAAQPSTPLVLPEPRNDEIALYIYTSGTTGLPKAAAISHKRWLSVAHGFGHAIFEATPRDVIYVCLPLYHSSALLCATGAAFTTGASIALRRRFSASQFWQDVHRFEATAFIYIGELCRYLLNAPPSVHERAHRVRVCSGNGMRPDVWEPFQRRFGVPLVREFYGATEGNTGTVNFEGRPGMVGRSVLGQRIVRCDPSTGELLRDRRGRCEDVAVGEAGVLLARLNPLLSFEGYLDRAATERKIVRDVAWRGDRYFHTGDILRKHDDGWLSFVDRVGDTFRWKGENVSTHEVAEALNRAPGVRESNVYGVAVPRREGRAGMASLHVAADFDLEAFARHVLATLASYQRPYFLRLQGDMRITGTLKHQKNVYRDEGFDPAQVPDPLYVLEGSRYLRIDADVYRRICDGTLGPR